MVDCYVDQMRCVVFDVVVTVNSGVDCNLWWRLQFVVEMVVFYDRKRVAKLLI